MVASNQRNMVFLSELSIEYYLRVASEIRYDIIHLVNNLVSLGSSSSNTKWVVIWNDSFPHGGGEEGKVVGGH